MSSSTSTHILNGDALKQQFPKNIAGEIIIARECLVDGDLKGRDLNELFTARAKFIAKNYANTKQEYYSKVVSEFLKIKEIKEDTDILLWFEDDLFCQVNFWFTAHLLVHFNKKNKIYLVRPKKHTGYGFGGLNKLELVTLYENRILLTSLYKIAALWNYYKNNNLQELQKTGLELASQHPFIITAINAHIERIPTKGNLGRPITSLIQIMSDLGTQEFAPVYKEFNKREPIYGFGDLQVKRLFDEIVKLP